MAHIEFWAEIDGKLHHFMIHEADGITTLLVDHERLERDLDHAASSGLLIPLMRRPKVTA